MDPNAALARLRELSAAIDKAESAEEVDNLGQEMATVFTGLDNWIVEGNFLPDVWRSKTDLAWGG